MADVDAADAGVGGRSDLGAPGLAPGRSASDESQLRAERSTGIGGSDAHHLRYEPPWGCRRKLWFEKRGVPQDYPDRRPETLAPLARGHRLEDIAAELYAETTERKVRRMGVRRRKDAPELLVHADRAIVGVEGTASPGVLEVKVPGERTFWQIAREGLPPAYVLQLQWAMMVTDWQWGAFAILWADGWRLLHFDVPRDDALCQALAREGRAFWREVEHGPMPSGLPAEDKRCARCPWRRTCHGTALPAAPPEERDERVDVIADATLEALLADYDDARALVAQDEELLERVRAAIKQRLGEREAVEVNGRRIYHRRAKDTVTLDLEAIRAAGESMAWIFQQYGKVRRGARSLRIY